MTLQYREVRLTSAGSTKAVWKQWGSVAVMGSYEPDKLSMEGDIRSVEKQDQERRGGVITLRFESDLASKISGKWRIKFSPMPDIPEETHLVRGFALETESERARFLQVKVEMEVK